MNREENTVSSAIVELKAELFRKQEEFRQKKLNNASYLHFKREKQVSKNDLWNLQNSGVLERAKRDREDAQRNDDEEDILLRSRNCLEEKAKLYDKIAQSSDIPDEDGSEYYLVDFQKKVIDSLVEERNNPDRRKNDHTVSAHLLTSRPTEMGTSEHTENDSSIYMATEAYRNKMKEKWDAEAQELFDKSQTDVHYSNVQFDEIRNHGVGFFQFSKDHEEREAELANLKKLHKETLDEQTRKDTLKNKRKAQMEERLAKVRQRRNLKEIVKPADTDVSEATIKQEQVSPIAGTIKQKPVSPVAGTIKQEPVSPVAGTIKQEPLSPVAGTIKQEPASPEPSTTGIKEHENIKKAVREWDIGKIVPGVSYVESRRRERESEFAPPTFYSAGATKESHKRQQISQSKTNYPVNYKKTCNQAASGEFGPYSDSSNPICKEQGISQFEKSDTKKELLNQIDHGALGMPTQTFDLFASNNLKEETSVFSSGDTNNQFYYSHYPQQCTFSNTYSTIQQNFYNDVGLVNNSVCPINYQEQYPLWPFSSPISTSVPMTDRLSLQQPKKAKVEVIDERLVQNEILTQRKSVPSLNYQQQNPVWPVSAPISTSVPMTDRLSLQQPKKAKVEVIDERLVQNEILTQRKSVPSLNYQQQNPVWPVSVSISTSCKCTVPMTESNSLQLPKKNKVPVIDTRFVKNENLASTSTSTGFPLEVKAVAYTPGIFTAAKQNNLNTNLETDSELRIRSEISGAPVMYAKQKD